MMSLTPQFKQKRQQVINLILVARTGEEVRQATAALRAWMEAHPEDTGILDGGEMLSHAEDAANLREAERKALGLNEEQGRERERVLVAADRAISVAEVIQARADLLRWRWRCPADVPATESYLTHLNQREALARRLEEAIANAGTRNVPPETVAAK